MPLLQHLLRRLWERRHGHWLRVVEYVAAGKVRGAITKTADGVYLDPKLADRRGEIRDIFVRLTSVEEDLAESEDWRHARRRVLMDELVPAGGDRATTQELASRLASARLVVVSADEVTGQAEVEVAHEELIRSWGRLRSWLRTDREILRLREGVRRAALQWKESAKSGSYLVHRGERLAGMMDRRSHASFILNALESDYLEECAAQEKQEEMHRGRRCTLLMTLGGGIGAGLGLGMLRAVTVYATPLLHTIWTQYVWWGLILGLGLTLGLLLPEAVTRERASARSEGRPSGPQTAGRRWPAVICGTLGFTLAHLLVAAALRYSRIGALALASLAAGVTGLGISVGLAMHLWAQHAQRRWRWGLSSVAVATGALGGQLILFAAGKDWSLAGGFWASIYRTRLSGVGAQWWLDTVTAFPLWYRVVGGLDAMLTGLALFLGIVAGVHCAERLLQRLQ
jgi:hypothetical protein